MSKKITEMFAFVCIDPDGNEAVPAVLIGDKWWPTMGADLDRIQSFTPYVQEMANRTGQTIRILKFTTCEQIGEVNPKAEPHA